MFGLATSSGPVQAATTVGIVFVEALVLYLGYGALSRLARSTVLDAIGGA